MFGTVNALYDLGCSEEVGDDKKEDNSKNNNTTSDEDNPLLRQRRQKQRRRAWVFKAAAAGLLLASYIGFFVYISIIGLPSPKSLGIGVARVPDMGHLFALGLLAG